MKRFIYAVLAVALCLTLTSCALGDMITVLSGGGGSQSSDDPTVGTWLCTQASALGLSVKISDIFKDVPKLIVKNRGNLTLVLDGESYNGKWTLEDDEFTLSAGGEKFTAVIDGNTMSFDDLMGISLVFEKEVDKTATASPSGGKSSSPGATATPAGGSSGSSNSSGASASGDDFIGFWVGKTASLLGDPHSDMLYGIKKVSESIFLELSDGGTARLYYMGEVGNLTWNVESDNKAIIDFMTVPCDLILENGELTFTLSASDVDLTMEFIFEPGSGNFDDKLAEVGGSDSGDDFGDWGDASASEYGPYDYQIPIFEGDWYGTLYINKGTGAYSGITGAEADALARFSFADGECLPFIAISITGGNPYVEDITATLSEDGILISGSLLDYSFEDALLTYNPDKDTPATIKISGGDNEAGYEATIYLRPWGQDWSSKDKHRPSDDIIQEWQTEWDLERTVADYEGIDMDMIPEITYEAYWH